MLAFLRHVTSVRSGQIGLTILVVFLLVAVAGPEVLGRDPFQHNLRATLRPVGQDGFWLGSDHLGRDLAARIALGARLSLSLAVLAVSFSFFIGIPLGVFAGYYGGPPDAVITRVLDVLLTLPSLLLAITVAAIYGFGYWPLIVAIGVPEVPIFARLARASTLTLRDRDHVEAARSLGARDLRVLVRHVVPGLLGPLVVQITFSMATAILNTGALSFLGIGIQPPTPEWGSMLAQGRDYMRVAPHLIVIPGIALALVVFGLNLFGDALRVVYDPRARPAGRRRTGRDRESAG